LIQGIGIDFVKVDRVRQMVLRRGKKGLNKLFTTREIDYCYRYRDPYPHLAARFSLKEAVLKALGIGWRRPAKWTDIEVTTGVWGQPRLSVRGALQRLFAKKGVAEIHASLSHSSGFVVSVAVLES